MSGAYEIPSTDARRRGQENAARRRDIADPAAGPGGAPDARSGPGLHRTAGADRASAGRKGTPPTHHGSRWYVAYTQQNCEELATGRLREQGFQVFTPRRRKTVRHARKLSTRLAALFPGYVFVAFDMSRDRWRSVNGTRGVRSLVMSGNTPIPVPQGVVETLLACADPGGVVSFEPDLRLGDRVRLVDGPFAEALGVLERLDGEGRVSVLLGMMSGAVRVNVGRRMVMPVAAACPEGGVSSPPFGHAARQRVRAG